MTDGSPLPKHAKPIVITDPGTDRYASLRLFDWWNQEKLSQAQVMVAGCGALGNEVLKNLALVGAGKIFLIDFDQIEAGNLSRSVLFRMADVGRPKVEAAAERVKEINPDVRVMTSMADLNYQIGLGVFRRMDVVIGCLDNREARMALNRNCWHIGVPWIDGGLMGPSGQLRIFDPPEGACYECTMTENDYRLANLRYSCQGIRRENIPQGMAPTGTAIAAIIAAMQVQEAIKQIHNLPLDGGQGIIYNSMTRQFYPLRYQRRSDCYIHETYSPIRLIPERTATMTVGQLLKMAAKYLGEGAFLELDRDLVYKLTGPVCKHEIRQIKNYRELTNQDLLCPYDGMPLMPERTHRLTPQNIDPDLKLAEIGIPPLHIIKARNGSQIEYFELSGDEPEVLNYQ